MILKRSGANSKVAGFTLLEVLIAIVILAIGLLGVAGLQVIGMRNNHSAYLRTQATLLAYDYADLVRANTELARKTTTFNTFDSASPGSVVSDCTDDNTGTSCTPAQMAATDLAQWAASLASTLPSGSALVTNNSAAKQSEMILTVTIYWVDNKSADADADDDNDGYDNTYKSFATSFRP